MSESPRGPAARRVLPATAGRKIPDCDATKTAFPLPQPARDDTASRLPITTTSISEIPVANRSRPNDQTEIEPEIAVVVARPAKPDLQPPPTPDPTPNFVQAAPPVVEPPSVIGEAASVNGPRVNGTAVNGANGHEATAEKTPKIKLLLIEDDTTIRMLLEMGLRKHNFDCAIAENGKAAQQLLQTIRPDLIVVDLLMPVMDGLAFIQWLRQTANDSTPVLVFTTVDDPKVTQEVLNSGADFFARKPLHLTLLVEKIHKLVSLGRQPKAASA